jgi:hypothetical protein
MTNFHDANIWIGAIIVTATAIVLFFIVYRLFAVGWRIRV